MNRFRPPVNLRERGPSGRGFLVKIAKLSPACSLAFGVGMALACFVPYYIRFIPYIIRYKTRYHTPSAFGVMSESELVVFVAFFVPFLFLCFFRVFYVLFILYYI